jgi:hypothetical protein
LETHDEKDYEVKLDEDYPMIWADNTKSARLMMHDYDGFLSVWIGSDGITRVDYLRSEKTDFGQHAILMTICWLFLASVLMVTMRWRRHWWKYSQHIHNTVGTAIAIVSFYSIIRFMTEMGVKLAHLHNILGFILAISLVLLSVTGWVSYMARLFPKKTFLVINVGKIHRYLGLLMFYTGIVTSGTGILRYFEIMNDKWEFLGPAAIAIMLVFSLGMEIRYQFIVRGDIPLQPLKKDIPEISEA